MAQVGWQQYHHMALDLSGHLRHGRGRGGSVIRVAFNRFGWYPIEHVTQTLDLIVEQVFAIARSDYFHPNGRRRYHIAMHEPIVIDLRIPPGIYGAARPLATPSIGWRARISWCDFPKLA